MKLTNNTAAIPAKTRDAHVPEVAGRRYEVMTGVSIAALLLVLLAILLAHTVLQGVGSPQEVIDEIRRSLVPDAGPNMKPEPLERWLFILLTLASPFCILAGLRVARMISRCITGLAKPATGRGIIAVIALLAGGVCIYLFHGISLFLFFVFPESSLIDQATLYAAAAFLFLVSWRKEISWLGSAGRALFTGLELNRMANRAWCLVAAVVVFFVTLLPRGLSIHSILTTRDISPFAWETHFQAVAYSLTQIYAGKPLLTASPPLYGYYAEFLLPVFKLIGLSVFKFCVVMGLIQAVALASILIVAVKHLRMRSVRFLCCAALLYFVGSTCLVGRRPFDPVFQYWPIRFIFPALSVSVYLWVARRATLPAWIVLGGFAGLALMWNLESGIAVAGAALFTLSVEAIGANCRRGSTGKRILLLSPFIAGCTMFLTGAIFRLFLEMQAGWKPPLHQTSEYQRLFYQSGLMMEPLPLAPHPWWVVIATYLLGLGYGMRGLLNDGRNIAIARLSLFLSILGAGLFTYYQGRSVDFNLMNAAWPAILLGFLFTDRLLRAIRGRLFPRGLCWLALPAAYLGMMAVVMLPGALSRIWSFGSEQWSMAMHDKVPYSTTERTDVMDRRIAFIRANVGSDPDCVILADYQAVYFMQTGLRSSMDAPGLTEFFFMKDLEMLRSALTSNPPRHLFVDEQTLKTLQLTDTIKEHYQTVATSPDGKLFYVKPLAGVR